MTKPEDGLKLVGEKDSDTLELAKETIEDLDASDETTDEARGGRASRSNLPEC